MFYFVFYTIGDSDNSIDQYEVVESESEARKIHEKSLEMEGFYCGGYGPITASTDWN